MVVTHLFQVLGFVAMEPPTSLEPHALVAEKVKVFDSMPPLDPAKRASPKLKTPPSLATSTTSSAENSAARLATRAASGSATMGEGARRLARPHRRVDPLLGRTFLPEDAEALASILTKPSVARWWGEFDQDRVERELIVGEPDVRVYAIEVDGRLVGAVQHRLRELQEDFGGDRGRPGGK